MDSLRRRLACGVAAAFLSFGTVAPAWSASPPVFKEMTFDAAKAESVRAGKVLVFDAMTSWCGPCKLMDKTAWVDPEVVAWLNANAVAIQLDMDKNPEVRNTLRIHAYPTIVAFRDGKEFDRIVGSRSGPDLLAWLKGVAKGESILEQTLRDLKEERAKSAAGEGTIDYRRRLKLAEALYEYGEYKESTAESSWLWQNMPRADAALWEARTGALSSVMADLAKRYAPAKTEFLAFRDAAAKTVQAGHPSSEELSEWLTLNAVVDDNASTVQWAVKMADTPDNVKALQSVGMRVFPLLVESGHWDTAGKALTDPVAQVDERGSQLGAYDVPVAPRTKPGSMPMIPLKTKDAQAAGEGKVVPAIPIMRKGEAPNADAAPKTVPAIPLVRKGDAAKAEDAPKTIPAIPLVRKGEHDEAPPKTVPAMPLMRKNDVDGAKPAGAEALPAIPEMGAPGVLDRNDPASVAREVRYRLTLEFRSMAAEYYAACLAAGRDAEAGQIAELTFKYTDTPGARLALAEAAVRAGHARPEHVKWMDEIQASAQAATALKSRLEEHARP